MQHLNLYYFFEFIYLKYVMPLSLPLLFTQQKTHQRKSTKAPFALT